MNAGVFSLRIRSIFASNPLLQSCFSAQTPSIINSMTGDDIRKLKKLIKEEIKPVKEVVEVVNHKVGKIDTSQTVMSAQVGIAKDQISVINDKLDIHTKLLSEQSDKLDNHTAALIEIEDTLKGYADMYKVNKQDNQKIKRRVVRIEDHLGIVPQE